MKLKKVLVIFSIVVMLLSTVLLATESDIMPINISEDNEVVYDNDWFYCAEKIDLVEETIEGNVFLIAQEVILADVNIMGSAYIITENLQLEGVNATGSLYTIAQKVNTQRVSFANIYSISEDITLNQETELFKNLYLISSNCEYNARTTKDVNIIGDNVKIGENANVLGTLNITGTEEPSIPETASIGEYNFFLQNIEENVEAVDTGIKVKNSIVKVLNYVLATVVIAFVIFKLFASIKEKVNDYKISNLVLNALIGLALVIGTPILIIILIATGIFSKLGFAILWMYILAFVISSPIAVIIISLMIAKKMDKQDLKEQILIIALVAGIVSILELISGISAVVGIIMGLIGFGSILKLSCSNK